MILWVVGIIVGIISVLYLAFKFFDGNQDFWTKQGIISVSNKDYFSLLQRFSFKIPFHVADVALYTEMKIINAKIAGNIMFRHPVLLVADLDVIKNILVKDFEYFMNRRGIDFSDERFDKMLFNKINQEWKDLRSTMSPAFSTSKIKRMFEIFNGSSVKMCNYLDKEIAKGGNDVEMRNVCGKYTLDVIASAAFGIDSENFDKENSEFARHGKMMQDNFSLKVMLKFLLLLAIPSLAKKFKFSLFNEEGISFFERILTENIRRRKVKGEKREDFLQMMIEAQESGEGDNETIDELDDFGKVVQKTKKVKLTDDVIMAQCTLFFFAGFDTVETVLMFALYELALQPELQEKLYDTLKRGTEKNGGKLSYEFGSQCEYLDMVVSETLRKYPPAVRLERKCNKDYEIPEHKMTIKKDSHVVVPMYGIHYDPDLYPDPEKFDPERFNQENKASRHPYAYLPFGLGPRACIANRFALIESKAALANLVLRFKYSPCEKTDVPIKYTTKGMLKPLNGVWLNLEPRE